MKKGLNSDTFIDLLKKHTALFSKAVSTDEGAWIIKGFIDIYKNIYTISVDTKIISKVIELLLFPMLKDFSIKNSFLMELCPQQNFYPDLTFIDKKTNSRFAIDIKTTYRINPNEINGMTLGAFTGYFRNRESTKNILYPYNEYKAHIVLGVIYSQQEEFTDERKKYKLEDLERIPSVIKDFDFFVQPKFKIATDRPGSGNTKNIGSVNKIKALKDGAGPFADLGEGVYDDFWMFYLTKDMARALEMERPYTNLKTFFEYKKKGLKILEKNKHRILTFNPRSKAEE